MTWFPLKGDERITGRCASEDCAGQPTWRLEAGGVGSNYCSGCMEKIEWSLMGKHPVMRTFTMYRRNVPDATHNADQKNAPDEPQFEGVQFSDGTVAIRCLTAKRSTAVWSSMEDMLAIHGHPEYGSELVWSQT